MENVKGYVHSVETAGTVDGPGIRYIMFTSGCPLRCLYCHNPDTRKMYMGKETDSFSVLKDIHEYKDYHILTGGGVTISGGEPLIQPGFINSIFDGCKKMGIHTALDTSGFMHENLKDEDFKNIDLVLLDIKSINADVYKEVTQVELAPTLEFAKRLERLNVRVWIRFVYVPQLTDDTDDIKNLAEFVSSLSNVEKVEVLPFHQMGAKKWKELDFEYKLTNTPAPTIEEIEKVKEIFNNANVKVG